MGGWNSKNKRSTQLKVAPESVKDMNSLSKIPENEKARNLRALDERSIRQGSLRLSRQSGGPNQELSALRIPGSIRSFTMQPASPLDARALDSTSKLSTATADADEPDTPLRSFLQAAGLGMYLRTFRLEGLEASPNDLSILIDLDEFTLNALLLDMNMKLVHKAVLISKLKGFKTPVASVTSPYSVKWKASDGSLVGPGPGFGFQTGNLEEPIRASVSHVVMSSTTDLSMKQVISPAPPENLTVLQIKAGEAQFGAFPRRGSDLSVKPRIQPNLPVGMDPVRKLFVPKWSCRQQKAAHDFFISYRVEADQISAEKLALLLETKSKHCFFDKRCLVDGMDWDQGFLNGLERSRYIILFCSEAALEKVKVAHLVEDNMLLEWERALILRDKNQVFVQPLLVAAYQDIQVGSKISKALLPFKAFDLSEFPDELMFHHLSTRTRTIREILSEIFKIQGIRLLPDEVEGTIPKLLDGLSRLQGQETNVSEAKMEVVELALTAREAKQLREWLRPLNMDDERSRQRRRHVTGTRQWLLKQVLDWALDHAEGTARVLWLRGASGLGKSVMAGYIADSLQSDHLLGAAFFCKHDDTERNDPKRVVETLAYSLSKWNPKFGRMLLKIRDEEPDLLQRGAGTTRFTKLLLNPLVTLNEMRMLKPVVLVVDALDEVGIKGQRNDFLKIFAQDCLRLPPCIKLFVTSRPDLDIVDAFKHMRPVSIEPSQEDNLNDLTKVAEKKLVDELKLSPDDAKAAARRLAIMSEGVFIWLNLAFYCLKEKLPANAMEDGLVAMEQVMTIVDKLPVGLDEMYKQTISSVYLSGPGGRPNTEIMRILGAVVCLREPVTESALSELIGMELVLLTSILRTAQAILNVSVRDAKVRVIHKSLKDHLTNPTRSHRRFRVRITEEHHRLGETCINILLRGLHRGIGAISDALSYACRYWAVHISGCLGTAPSLLRLIDRMSSERLPEWLEALSYLKSVDKIAVASLRSLVSWYPHTSIASPVILAKQEASRSVNGPRATRVLMTDLLRMVLEFRAPIVESPEDVYRSALPFCPSLSALCQAYSHRYKGIPSVYRGRDARWGPCLFSLGGQGRDDSAPVLSVSISSDGSRFLSGSADGSLRLWSLETGEALKVFEWDAGEISVTKTRVEAAAIGYGDGNSTIGLTTSEEGNLVIWSFELGAPLRQIPLDPESMDSAASESTDDEFEEDWRESDPSLPFIAGNRFGKATGWACMTAIVFSKETRVVVIAGDEKIASISLDTGKTLWMRKESRCQIILVKAVQQNTKLIVGAGSAIRILAADTGSPLSSMEIAHHLITALAATKDGTIIAYGSDDALIRLINSDDGTTLCTLAGHHGPITSIDISPDGRKVVSASSDGTVRIWLSIPSPKTSDYQSHRNGELSLSCEAGFSSAENIESSSDPSSPTSPVTIELSSRLEGADLYDTASSSSEVGTHITLEGHTQGVTCVSITPDGHRVVSGSIDGTIKIWSLDTLGTAERSEESHTDIVLCVAISKSYLKPDTSSDDSLDSNHSYKDGSGTIYHRGSVDLKRISTTSRPDLFPEKVTSSPTTAPKVSSPLARDSTVASKPIITSLPELDVSELVASGSRDRTVKLWSTSTGDLLHTFKGHMAPVYSVAIRTDRKMVASGSSDGVIKLWSVASGNLIRDFHHGGDHGGRVKDLEFTADGTRLLSWIENKVLVWHLHNGILENRIDGPVRLCADHRHICVQDSTSGLEKILDTATFMEVAAKDQPKPAPSRDVKIVNGWVVDADAKRVMWLPEEFRGMAMTDYSGKFLVLFGYKGRECFIRL